MEAESFFQRWSRRKSDEGDAPKAPSTDARVDAQNDVPAVGQERLPPTLDDVAKLTTDSDFKPFVARGVDEEVRRTAMKKLFTDPHFNIMDGLDIYIDDYTKSDPIPPAMLAMMSHAQTLLKPQEQIKGMLAELLDATEEKPSEEESPKTISTEASAQARDDAATTAGAAINTESPSDTSSNDHAI